LDKASSVVNDYHGPKGLGRGPRTRIKAEVETIFGAIDPFVLSEVAQRVIIYSLFSVDTYQRSDSSHKFHFQLEPEAEEL
jgi:hypothetical protein